MTISPLQLVLQPFTYKGMKHEFLIVVYILVYEKLYVILLEICVQSVHKWRTFVV